MENNSNKSCLSSASNFHANSPPRLPHRESEINSRVRVHSSLQLFAGWKDPAHQTLRLTVTRCLFNLPATQQEVQILTPLSPDSRGEICWLHCTPIQTQSTLHTLPMSCAEVTSVPGCRPSQGITTVAVLPIYLYTVIPPLTVLHGPANTSAAAHLVLLA